MTVGIHQKSSLCLPIDRPAGKISHTNQATS